MPTIKDTADHVPSVTETYNIGSSSLRWINGYFKDLNISGSITGLDLSSYALKSNVLELDNTSVFTPSSDYHPATKKYVDDENNTQDSIISLNTTHRTSNGSDHTYIDQDVTNGSAPILDATNFTNLPSASPAGSDGDLQVNISGSFGTINGLNLDTTGNTRGTDSLDIQSSRSGVTQVASGDYATAIGYQNTASGTNSFACGYQNVASAPFSLSFGVKNNASGYSSSASGYQNVASGERSTCSGNYAEGTMFASTASGYQVSASGYYSTTIGSYNKSQGNYSTTIGVENTASASYSSALGSKVTNTTANSVEVGVSNVAKVRISSAGFDALFLPIIPATMADSSAPNNSIYYSSTASKLVYKDAGGTVNNLY